MKDDCYFEIAIFVALDDCILRSLMDYKSSCLFDKVNNLKRLMLKGNWRDDSIGQQIAVSCNSYFKLF
jgi:hypothetical protein